MSYQYHDGGRSAAGYSPYSGTYDCSVRAMAIALDMNYQSARILIKSAVLNGPKKNRSISRGVTKSDFDRALRDQGWQWRPAPKFKGRKARYSDIPGTAIVRMAHHYAAVIDGVLLDTWDSSAKMVYGYWAKGHKK